MWPLGGPFWHGCCGAVVGRTWSPFAFHGSFVAWYVLLNLISRCVPSFITCRHCPCLQDNAKSQVPILYKDNTYQKITCFFVPSTTRHFSQLLIIRIFSNSGILVAHYFAHERTTPGPESCTRFCLSYVKKRAKKRQFWRCYLPNGWEFQHSVPR